MIKVAIFGNRNITDETLVKSKFGEFLVQANIMEPLVLLHGGAAGPAQILSDYANSDNAFDWTSIIFKPWTMIWSKLEFQPIYFYLRNKQIVENSDVVFILTNGEKDSEVYRVIDLCKRWDKEYFVLEV